MCLLLQQKKCLNEKGRDRIDLLRFQGYFEDSGGLRGTKHTIIIDLIQKVDIRVDIRVVFKIFFFKICIRMNTIWQEKYQSYKIDENKDDDEYECMKINVEISQFDISEIGFTNGFCINHFGHESKEFYDYLKNRQKKHKVR